MRKQELWNTPSKSNTFFVNSFISNLSLVLERASSPAQVGAMSAIQLRSCVWKVLGEQRHPQFIHIRRLLFP